MSHRYHYYQPRPRRSCHGAGRRLLHILAVGVVVAVGVYVLRGGQAHRRPSPPPAPQPMAGMTPRHLQAYSAESGVAAGAAAAHKELAAHPHPLDPESPDPTRTVPVNAELRHPEAGAVTAPATAHPVSEAPGKPKPAIRVRVRSEKAYPSRDQALNDALVEARKQIRDQLEALDPSVKAVPSIETVRTEYMRPETESVIQPTAEVKKDWENNHLEPNRVWVEVTFEVTDDQVRQLRAEHRLGVTGWVGAMAFVVVLAVFGFLRLDNWTKGYLTAALAVGFAAAAGGAVALMLLAR